MKKLLALLVAAVVGISSVACSTEDNAVAYVDGKAITKQEFEEHLKFNKWITELQYGPDVWEGMLAQNPNAEETIKSQMLDTLIQTKVALNYAEKNNIKPDEKESKEIKSQIDKMIKDQKSKDAFIKAGITEDFIKKYGEQASLLSGFNKYMKEKSKPTEKELKEYYEKNSEKVDAAHILISTKDEKGNPMTEDKKAEAKKKADEVYKRAKNGEDFAKLAKEFSADPGSAQKGGELGAFGKGQMVKEFEETAFALTKEGEISKPVESQFGYHIIKLNKKIKSDFKEVKDSLKEELAQKKAGELAQKIYQATKVEKKEDKLKEIKFFDKKGSDDKMKDEKKPEEKKDEKASKEKKEEK